MKKTIILLSLLALLVSLASCRPNSPDDSSASQTSTTVTTETELSSTETTISTMNVPMDLPKYVDGTIEILPEGQLLLDFPHEMHYRWVYYDLPNIYCDMVPHDEAFREFMRPYEETNDQEPQVMLLAMMIQYFNIPREEFDKAEQQYIDVCISMDMDMTTELWEVPNGDIIYTFDHAIINEYYRRA